MRVTITWTDAMRRLTRHIADLIEDTNLVPHGDMYWLETLISFRDGSSIAPKAVKAKVANMFDSSGLAGVLLGEEHFPALEKRKIYSIHLVDHQAGVERSRLSDWNGSKYPNELVMGCPSYPGNWRH
tara:strand:+ start:218 stop:598 length:381 start_codon:yes stop_codon:yes gene_type:complete